MNGEIRVIGSRYSFVRRVSKMGKVFVITVPKSIGSRVHGKTVQVTIEVLEEVGG